MFTEQAIGVPFSLALASNVILEESGSLRYFSFRGFWISRRSVLMLSTLAVADLSDQNYIPTGVRPKLASLGGCAEGEPEKVPVVGMEVEQAQAGLVERAGYRLAGKLGADLRPHSFARLEGYLKIQSRYRHLLLDRRIQPH